MTGLRIGTISIHPAHVTFGRWVNDGLEEMPIHIYNPFRGVLESITSLIHEYTFDRLAIGIPEGNTDKHRDLKSSLTAHLGLPIQVINNAHASAIGESTLRTPKGLPLEDLAYIYIGGDVQVATREGLTGYGHVIINSDSSSTCPERHHGCATALLSGKTISDLPAYEVQSFFTDLSSLIFQASYMPEIGYFVVGGAALQLSDKWLDWLNKQLRHSLRTVQRQRLSEPALHGLHHLALQS